MIVGTVQIVDFEQNNILLLAAVFLHKPSKLVGITL